MNAFASSFVETPCFTGNLFRLLCVFTIATATVVPAIAQDDPSSSAQVKTALEKNLPQQLEQSIERGILFLKRRGQNEDGSFSPETGVAVTALCVRAFLEHHGNATNDSLVVNGLRYIEERIQSDGGIYERGSRYRNYETSIAVGALIKANQKDRFESVLSRADAFLKQIQWDEGEGVTKEDAAYGGAGYGSHQRPDLSNTAFMVQALRELGNDPEDEAIQKALTFIVRTQNLKGHGNDTQHADKIGDGGFYYTPAAGGQTKAEPTGNGGLRSYASMTYAGLKSMIYAGLAKDDPRVVAAMDFIQKNYALDSNPGMGKAGLFYYYHTFAKALDVADIDVLDDGEGIPHVWRKELARTLIELQQEDGSWVNRENERWMEGDRQLVTAYALMALSYCNK